MTRSDPADSVLPPIVAVVGATAAGKTGLSLDLAEALGGEVVNTDSVQVYRGMDIGTAKLPPDQRRGIEHHLIDVLDVAEQQSVAVFQQTARQLISTLRDRGTTPVLVGGSALYTRAVLDHFDFPGTDPVLRARLEGELQEQGPARLYARLVELDPEAATRIRPDNGRRIVRALEVIELTGDRFTARLPELTYRDPQTVQLGVDIDREALHRRIEERVVAMFEAGFVAEVERLLAAGLAQSRTAAGAIGYRQVADHLRGRIGLEEAQARTVVATRQFARRQDAWFRKDPRIHWIRYDDPARLDAALAAVPER